MNAELVSGLLLALVGGGGVWSWLDGRGKRKADLITIAQDAAKEVIGSLREEIERHDRRAAEQDRRIAEQGARIVELEVQDERCRRELAATRDELEVLKRRIG